MHGALGELAIDLNSTATGWNAVIEPRKNGVQKIEVDFDVPAMEPLVGTIVAQNAVSGTTIPASAQMLVNDGTTLVIEFAGGLPDEACYRIDLAVTSRASPATPTASSERLGATPTAMGAPT